ncbi:efflux RND transporter periplasmic adaptor subunit [Pseudomonas sp. S75]|uniref:efflux RND transporter periplasmic adaptor subunit n=1 Tax=unclassified Pseudomonas TaxID=196821 RepID=UPI001905FB46|nr:MULTISPECIES: efflux RND transporter periplasmic adaptor subunit [unclassified Pseudomonas]MBJ9974048.1 efflux RND transporter periplasmic adaptor subunit [Pseudomonas sp. S30]MBK0152022.1 efflux RND transporter periplasmic adaptor subunit [Pseudomonas sp. S75]
MRLRPAALVGCLLPFTLAACGDSAPDKDPRDKPPVVRAAVVQDARDPARTFTGVVVARTQSDLGFRVSGKILQRLVDTGETVTRGQPLMRLDPVDLNLQARAQHEAVAAARAKARQTADDEARYRRLVAEGAVSASAYDQLKAAADSAKAELSAAQAQADVATNATGYAVLLADADGVVMETFAEPGQVVSAGQVVVRVARAGQREALVHLPETLRPEPGSSALATLFGKPAQAMPARLRLLSDAADAATRTFEARYVLTGPLASAPLGATVTLDIARSTNASQARQVPVGALFDQGGGAGIWMITGQPAKVTRRAVEVLSVSDESAVVRGELEPGDRVVALGAHLLHEGAEVMQAAQTGLGTEQPR